MPEGHDPPERRAGADPEAAFAAREVYEAVAALPADFRDVIVAVDVVGLSYKEAARSLRTRVGTIMSRLYRAREQVAAILEAS
jgi:RNA polymerase sigma-70 factor (ECF subfamily)